MVQRLCSSLQLITVYNPCARQIMALVYADALSRMAEENSLSLLTELALCLYVSAELHSTPVQNRHL